MSGDLITVDVAQGSAAWLAMRAGRLTGSQFAAAAGVKAYKSRPGLWRQKTGRQESFKGNAATRWGHRYEPEARMQYALETGQTVEEIGFAYRTDLPWIGVSPDGFVGEDGMVEFKCPGGGREEPPTAANIWDEPPAYYVPQVMGQMAVCGRSWCDFVCYVPGAAGGMRVWRFEASEDYWEALLFYLREFQMFVVSDESPPSLRGVGRRTLPEVKWELLDVGG